jgi:ribosomal protein S18 acetylase RimI-like enzyme
MLDTRQVADLIVRPATLDDLADLAGIDALAFRGSARWDELRTFLTGERGWMLLAEADAGAELRIAGYIAVAPKHFFGRDFVALVVVAESARRQGVATQLIDAALARASTRTIFTSTNASNAAMRALMSRGGWLISGELDGLDNGDPEIVFYRKVQ